MKPGRARVLLAIAAAAIGGALAFPLDAAAARDDDRREARVEGFCSGSSKTRLRVRARDGSIRVELEVDTRRRGAPWSVILLHERRIVFRGTVRTARGNGSLRLRRTMGDLFGTDTIVVRATGPRRETCRVSATV